MPQRRHARSRARSEARLGFAQQGFFPIDVNRAPRETLLRVPGLGARVVKRILTARRHVTLRIDDLARLVHSLDAVRPFVVTPDWRPTGLINSALLAASLGVAVRVSLIFLHECGQGAVKIVSLESEIDFEGFRRVARAAATSGVRPDAIRFVTENAEQENDLFSEQKRLNAPTTGAPLRVPPRFLDLADLVCRHKEPTRYDLLYAALLRLRETPRFLEIASDPLVRRLRTWSARCGGIATK